VLVGFNLKKCCWGGYDKEKIIKILKDLEFYSLLEKLPERRKKDFPKQSNPQIGENLKLW
jgi:hypothetical protein